MVGEKVRGELRLEGLEIVEPPRLVVGFRSESIATD